MKLLFYVFELLFYAYKKLIKSLLTPRKGKFEIQEIREMRGGTIKKI